MHLSPQHGQRDTLKTDIFARDRLFWLPISALMRRLILQDPLAIVSHESL